MQAPLLTCYVASFQEKVGHVILRDVNTVQNASYMKIKYLKQAKQNKMKPTNPNAHTYRCQNTWLCSHAQYLSAIVFLNSLVHVSLVTSLQCGVESVECGVRSVK